MSTIKDRTRDAVEDASVRTVDMKLEVIVLPVADVERAKAFYSGLGWRLDADFSFDNGFRVVQLTPPGSAASIQFGPDMTSAAPGSVQNSYLIVSDIDAARDALAAHGVEVSDAFHAAAPGDQFRPDASGHVNGRSSDSYSSFASFNDPDGNRWLLQEVTTRLPGRIESDGTSFGSASDLADAMRRAEAAHGEHEKRTGQADLNWPDWYARYMVAEQAGTELPT